MKLQIMPAFEKVQLVTGSDAYNMIYDSEQKFKSAWLLDGEKNLWEFIEELGEADDESSAETPFNFHDFHIAYNLKFTAAVMLMGKSTPLQTDIKNFAELLNAVLKFGSKARAVFIQADNRAAALKLQLIQQFIYLRMYLPVIIAESVEQYKPALEKMTSTKEPATGDIGIFGTKKSGKSLTINALLGDDYAANSPEIPTPNKVIYTAANPSAEITLTYNSAEKHFQTAKDIQKYLLDESIRANKNSATLGEMQVAVPNFPLDLTGFRIIDTPGPNFAGNEGYSNITKKTVAEVSNAIFVMNYSQYLTQDEINLFDFLYKKFKKTVLIAINRVDEIYDSEETKSYERVEDYIHCRLTALGYTNFLVVGVSALQAVYFKKIIQLMTPAKLSLFARIKKILNQLFSKPVSIEEQLKTLKNDYRGTDLLPVIIFVSNVISDFEDFHGIAIKSVDDLQNIDRFLFFRHIMYCMIHDLV